MNRISIPKVVVGSGVAFLGGLVFDDIFLTNPKILRIFYHSFMGAMMVCIRENDQPYLLPTIAAPFVLFLRKSFLLQGSTNLFWGIFFAAKLASDELQYWTQSGSSVAKNKSNVERRNQSYMCIIASVHQLASWYFIPHATWMLDRGVKALDGRKSRWLAAIGALVGTGLWSSSGYWASWLNRSNPLLYATVFVECLQERPFRSLYRMRTSIRNRFDQLLFQTIFGRSSPYEYRSLKHLPRERHKSEIRLLNLRAANSLGVIKANLIHIPMCHAPPFEAISYRWVSGNDVPILLDNQKFAVTGEVHKLLRALRYERQDRLLWIDSICIDQKNNNEKSWQIGFMKDIYSSADRVIGWITVEPEMICLPGSFSSLKKLGVLNDFPDEFTISFLYGELCAQMRGAIISLSNEFFFRTWIIQEVTLARNLVLMFYGKEVSWEDFMKAVLSFKEFHEKNSTTAYLEASANERTHQAIAKIQKMNHFRSELQTKPEGLLLSQLLLESADFHVTDLHDRVFGILGLSTDDARDKIPVRYDSDETARVATINATRYVLIEESSFILLDMGGIGYFPPPNSGKPRRPTWLPWWDLPLTTVLQERTSTSHSLYQTATWASITILGRDYTDTVLRIQSIFVDRIQLLSNPWFALDALFATGRRNVNQQYLILLTLQSLIDEAFSIVQNAHHLVYKDVDHRMLVWRTICHDGQPAQEGFDPQTLEEYITPVESAIQKTTEVLPRLLKQGYKDPIGSDALETYKMGMYGLAISRLASMRHARLCVTETGYFGIVPAYAVEGDEIWAFLGAPNPVLLRKSPTPTDESEEIMHQLVGVCYVDGIMDGELESAGLEPTQVNLI